MNRIALVLLIALMLVGGTVLVSQRTIAADDKASRQANSDNPTVVSARYPGSTSAPYLVVSHERVIPSQTIRIDVSQHSFALNPYQLRWVESGTGVFDMISATLNVDQAGNRSDVRYSIPAGNQGTFYVETRRDELITRSIPIEAVAPLYTYLPAVLRGETAVFHCPASSSNEYVGGTASQTEEDNPVRPAFDHGDKNIALRGYALNLDAGLKRELVDYGSGDPTQPPQFATLFSPTRVPDMQFFRVNDWYFADSPAPGTRGDPIESPPVTALGLGSTPGEILRVPTSGYDIGGGFEVIVLFADEDTVTLAYKRQDTVALWGYTLHIDNICTDPNLLTLYNTLDDPQGPRYVYVEPDNRPYEYDLPTLAAGQTIGTAGAEDPVVAVVDSGTLQDPRSCNEWWQTRPGYTGSCPPGP